MSAQKKFLYATAQTDKRLLMRTTGIAKAFGGQQVLDGIDLELYEGQVVLLQGPNGSGKTTLLNILTGNIVPDAGSIELFTNGCHEIFRFPRSWWQNLNPWDHFLPERVAKEGVGRSWQDTRLFNSLQLIDNIAVAGQGQPGENPFNLFFHPSRVHTTEKLLRAACNGRLSQLGLKGLDTSSGDKISLGQTKRVAIARAVQAGARILFLDEPLAGLDNDGIANVIELLRDLATQHHVTLVIIEHIWNVHHVRPLVDTVWNLKDGTLLVEPNHNPSPSNVIPDRYNFRIAEMFPDFRLTLSLDFGRGATLDVYSRSGSTDSEVVLDIRELAVHRGRSLIIGSKADDSSGIRGISLKLCTGELAVLQAPNGWGKTTLLDTIAGLLPVSGGTVTLLGKNLTHCSLWERSLTGLKYFRSNNRGFPSLTIADVARICRLNGVHGVNQEVTDQTFGELSGGQKQKLQLECMRDTQAGLYLLDEPLSALDAERIDESINAFTHVLSHGKSCVIIALPATQHGG